MFKKEVEYHVVSFPKAGVVSMSWLVVGRTLDRKSVDMGSKSGSAAGKQLGLSTLAIHLRAAIAFSLS